MDDKIAAHGLTFRAGEKGFVFYDDSRFTGEMGRTWAFGTVQEAAHWLVSQFDVGPDALSCLDVTGTDTGVLIKMHDGRDVHLDHWVVSQVVEVAASQSRPSRPKR